MPLDVAQLMVTVGADTGGAEAGISRIAGMLLPGGGLLLGVGAAVAAVAGIGIAATHMAGDFQAGMTSLVTGAGEAKGNLQLVSDGILQMAKDTGTSTKQLTDGMYMIESAGFHGQAGLDILKNAAEGAKVGNADLGTVADATTTILKDFGDTGITSSGAVNELIATVASGKTHMQDLAGSLAMILPTASSARVGLNDVMGAMATMTGEGVPAADAATYLRQMMIALDAPASGAKKALEGVGLSSADVAAEMQKSLPDALQMITDAVGKKFPVGSAAYVDAIKTIAGGSKQMQGFLDLTGQHAKDFQTNVGGIGDAAKKSGSAIAGWGDVQGDFNFKLDKAKEVVETLFIALGTKLLPVAGEVVDLFSGALSAVLPAVTNLLSGLGTASKPVTDTFVELTPAARHGAEALSQAHQAVQPLTGAITQLVTAAKPASDGLHALHDAADAKPAQALLTAVQGLATAIGGAFTTVVKGANPLIQQLGSFFTKDLLPAVTQFATFAAKTLVPAIAQIAVWFEQHVLPIVIQVAGIFLTDVLPAVEQVATAILTKLVPPLEKLWNTVSPILIPALQLVGAVLKNVVGPALSDVITIVGWLIDKLADLLGALSPVGDLLKNTLGGISNATGAVGNVLSHIPGFADGGTMPESGWALVGERGPELVQLPGGAQVHSNPSGIAGAGIPVSGTNASGQPVILQVDGRQLARALLPHLPGVVAHATGVRTM